MVISSKSRKFFRRFFTKILSQYNTAQIPLEYTPSSDISQSSTTNNLARSRESFKESIKRIPGSRQTIALLRYLIDTIFGSAGKSRKSYSSLTNFDKYLIESSKYLKKLAFIVDHYLIRREKQRLGKDAEIVKYHQYKKSIFSRTPYFGPIMYSDQSSRNHKFMRALLLRELKKRKEGEYNIVEVGSWAGSSAIFWASILKEFKEINGTVFCIDPFKPFVKNDNKGFSQTAKKMSDALKDYDGVFELFNHNVKATHNDDIIVVAKGYSDQVYAILGDCILDFIFLDGAHNYSSVIKDLRNSGKKLRDEGIICGDDLELQIHEVDISNARKNCEKDYIFDSGHNRPFHPGVTMAIADYFDSKVSCWASFWAMQKKMMVGEQLR